MDCSDSAESEDFQIFSKVLEKLEGFSRNLFVNLCWVCSDWVNSDETCSNEIFQAFLQSFILKRIENKGNLVINNGESGNGGVGICLCDYQILGIYELCKFFRIGVNGILADEFGLGKITEICAFLNVVQTFYKNFGKFLIVCNLSSIEKWIKALNLFNPQMKLLIMSKNKEESLKNLKKSLKNLKSSESLVVLTNAKLCKLVKNSLKHVSWQVITLDIEIFCQNSINDLNFFKDFRVNCQILLIREKFSESEEDLWHLLDFILPNVIRNLPVYNEFLSILNRHKEFLKHSNMKSRILTILKPFSVHRSQSEVKLKKKFYYERKHFSKLSIWQQDLYDSFINDYKTLKNSVKHSTNDKTKYLTLLLQIKKICNHAYLFENIEESDSISFHTHCINIKTSPIQYFIHKLLFILYKKTTSSCNFLKTSEIFWIFSKLNLTIENGLALLYGNDIQKLVILFHSLTNLPKSQPFELFSIKNKFTDQILPKPLKTSLKFFMPKVEAGQFIIKTSSVQLSEKFYELLLRPLTSCASNCFNSNESYSPIDYFQIENC